jgi:hypothetical protein
MRLACHSRACTHAGPRAERQVHPHEVMTRLGSATSIAAIRHPSEGQPMTTALRPAPRSGAAATATAAPPPADAFVAFGITGDLAKVMTFRSLYRLERRGLLGCPMLVRAAMNGESTRFAREDSVEETWRVMQPLIAVPPYAPGTWGPEAAHRLIAEDGRWYGPWVAS